jgi:hypothetical protein
MHIADTALSTWRTCLRSRIGDGPMYDRENRGCRCSTEYKKPINESVTSVGSEHSQTHHNSTVPVSAEKLVGLSTRMLRKNKLVGRYSNNSRLSALPQLGFNAGSFGVCASSTTRIRIFGLIVRSPG